MSSMIEFVLFLDPQQKCFFSFSPARGLIVQEMTPPEYARAIDAQIAELRTCMEGVQFGRITQFQRRALPQSYLVQRKFKFPVYYTDEQLYPAQLENLKFSETGQQQKESLQDHIPATIHLHHLLPQLSQSKKQTHPDLVSIDIKLIASVNEVLRTINRVILQDYGVVITTSSNLNKLVFKVKEKDEYMYGNQSIGNYAYIRECIQNRERVELEIHQENIYEKEQFMRYIFYRNVEDVQRGEFATFPWKELLDKYPSKAPPQFLMWYTPEDSLTHPSTFISLEKLYSTDQLMRTNQKIKLRLEEKRRVGVRRGMRMAWKEKIQTMIDKRKAEIKGKIVEIQGSIGYSGEIAVIMEIKVTGISNLYKLFIPSTVNSAISKTQQRKFLKFHSKQMYLQGNFSVQLPSTVMRYMQFAQFRKHNYLPLLAYMLSIDVEYCIGARVVKRVECPAVVAKNHTQLCCKVQIGVIKDIPMQASLVFAVKVHSKEGDGLVVGVGALKLYDSYGYLRQGLQEVHLYAMDKIEYYKLGCIDHHLEDNPDIGRIHIMLPKFRHPVIWTLADPTCLKLLGYSPQAMPMREQPNLSRFDQLLKYDPVSIYKYTPEDKKILRQCKKYYKHQSDKLINYLLSIDWTEPSQISQVYTALNEWAPLKPIQALFILNPFIIDQKVRYYAVKRMEGFLDFEFVLYANQITQALVSFQTHANPLFDLLIEKCLSQPYTVGQQYFWQFKNRTSELFTSLRFNYYLQSLLMVSQFRNSFCKQVKINNELIMMNEKLIKQTEGLSNFIDKNSKFEAMLDQIETSLKKIQPQGFSFPIRPQNVFIGFNHLKCKMFDSKKLPFCLACIPSQNSPLPPYKVMFKYGDDIKQDHLILQLFRIFNKLWSQAGLDLKMNIYKVLSTGDQIGFIELVDADNNSWIHGEYGKGLVSSFDQRTTYLHLERFNKDKKDFHAAKENFLRSSAAYLVATYITGIGDRHSGNVMVQKNGKFFHIDFGHILGNFKQKFGIKRERAPMLFTSQFLYVIGGESSKQYLRFQDLCGKAFNILRKNAYLIVNLLIAMLSAEIPQLRQLSDIEYVVKKLELDLSDTQASQRLVNVIKQTLASEKSRKFDNLLHEANRVG